MARSTFTCPHCGATVRRGAAVCRECGSDASTGWSEDAETGGLDLPGGYSGDAEFDYQQWLREELSQISGVPAWRNPRLWRRVALLLLVVLLALLIALV